LTERPRVGSYTREAAVAVVALFVLATLSYWGPWATADGFPISVRLALIALGALASIHAPLGSGSLGLGAAVLPLGVAFLGPTGTGWLAASAYLLRGAVVLLLPANRFPERSRWRITGALEAAARLALAGLAAGAFGRLAAARAPEGLRGLALVGLVSLLAYLAVAIGLSWASFGSVASLLWRSATRPLALDLGAWAFGLVLVAVVQTLGWPPALLLLTVLAVMSLEAARNAGLRQLALGQVSLLREVARAGHRIIFRRPDVQSIAEQIHIECGRVVPFSWFHFELVQGDEKSASWTAGPGGKVEAGPPAVPENPEPLPGVHRRSSWTVVKRDLVTEEQVLARMRLWCDPRRLDPSSLDLLDTLLPQMAAAIHRALLDRQARHDSLTGLPDRRSLESRLERAFADCLEDGTPMAVVMCDLDRFKRINDRIGHAAGDQALIEIARLMEDHRRETDLCCRYGGEEFALVLERSDGQTALRVAERLRAAVAQLAFVVHGRKVPLRISAGVAAFPELAVKSPADLLELADDALYEAKRQGRDRCLLNVGGNRFMDVEGGYTDDDDPQQRIEVPTLFA
jgi:diguanylate cyclase (GGDEF)-like protein